MGKPRLLRQGVLCVRGGGGMLGGGDIMGELGARRQELEPLRRWTLGHRGVSLLGTGRRMNFPCFLGGGVPNSAACASESSYRTRYGCGASWASYASGKGAAVIGSVLCGSHPCMIADGASVAASRGSPFTKSDARLASFVVTGRRASSPSVLRGGR